MATSCSATTKMPRQVGLTSPTSLRPSQTGGRVCRLHLRRVPAPPGRQQRRTRIGRQRALCPRCPSRHPKAAALPARPGAIHASKGQSGRPPMPTEPLAITTCSPRRTGTSSMSRCRATRWDMLNAGNRYLVHANHFISPSMRSLDAGEDLLNSRLRQLRVERLIDAAWGTLDVHTMKSIFSDHANYPKSVCKHHAPKAISTTARSGPSSSTSRPKHSTPAPATPAALSGARSRCEDRDPTRSRRTLARSSSTTGGSR